MSELHRFLDEARELLPAAVALRRRIHAKPELGLNLPLTTAAVVDALQGCEVEIARGPSTSGLVVSQKSGRVRTCSINPAALAEAERWITERRLEWERRFDRLGEYLKTLESEGKTDEHNR